MARLAYEPLTMSPEERWPYLCLLAGHILYIGEPEAFHEIDRIELDRTEAQLGHWIDEVVGPLDQASLKERIRVKQHYRYPGPANENGLQAWHDYVFVFDGTEVLIEEVLSFPKDVTQPPIRMRRFSR